MTTLTGACHCGNLRVELSTSLPAEELTVRACQCPFCRRHGSRTVSDPDGAARISVADPAAVSRYLFGLRTAEFLVCARCGVYVGAVMPDGGRHLAILNANTFDAPLAQPAEPVRYDDETVETRTARRRARWTPADVVGL